MKALYLVILLIPSLLFSQEAGLYKPGAWNLGNKAPGMFRPQWGTIQVKRNGSTLRLFTISALNSFSLQAGDSVLFQKGQTYRGQVNITQSGTAGSPIVISSYGSGAKPIISGAEVLTGWKARGSYYATKASQDVKNLFADGVQMTLARFPNLSSGVLIVDDTTGKTGITCAEVTQDSGTFNGANIRGRSALFGYETRVITVQDGADLTFPATTGVIDPDWGFYIDNSLAALDSAGEWAGTDTAIVKGYNVDNVDAFGSHAHALTGHATNTADSVPWAGFSTAQYATSTSPNLKAILQTVVSRESWAADNYFGIFLKAKALVANHLLTVYDVTTWGPYAARIRVVYH